MRALPEDFEAEALVGSLADGWGLEFEAADHVAVGGGSHHWVATNLDGTRGFVTVDDLDRKPWLGDTRESVFDGLRRAFDTAVALRDSGLGFVVAPMPSRLGETVRRIGPRYTIALFPFVDGRAGRFGRFDSTDERVAVVALLAELHQATSAVASTAPRIGLDLPGRHHLEAGLRDLNQGWSGGPFSEPARRTLASHASEMVELLALADRLSAEVARHGGEWVVTHGEPHAANVMRTGEGRVLVDWDTVAMAPPERDLWMVVDDTEEGSTNYTDATGHAIDQVAVQFFRLTWDLKDLASFIEVLRAPHRYSEDTKKAYDGLVTCVSTRDRWAALLG